MSSMHDIRSSCEEIVTTMLVITIMFVIMESPNVLYRDRSSLSLLLS